MSKPTTASDDRLLTAKEAAAFLGVALATIRQWTYLRRLPVIHVAGGRAARYRLSTLCALVTSWERPALRDPAATTH